ncbi:hypothetical protein [Deinococcus hopiensis]|uniref:Uncharacterized protein n=1 Tax=Deinococcus hopiensis KR-140 TaxID=695939 RepID=A0A1W1UJT3_9DEIO|nr:hypothetical protein [Deinococcus hopiensis]SMB81340.1 hypothetical protein SAMN00790413_04546 [Deinococcus hopiensis KR-140]
MTKWDKFVLAKFIQILRCLIEEAHSREMGFNTVLAFRYAITVVIDDYCGGSLMNVSKALFCGLLRVLRRLQPEVSKAEFGRLLNRSASYVYCLTSRQPEHQARCAPGTTNGSCWPLCIRTTQSVVRKECGACDL